MRAAYEAINMYTSCHTSSAVCFPYTMFIKAYHSCVGSMLQAYNILGCAKLFLLDVIRRYFNSDKTILHLLPENNTVVSAELKTNRQFAETAVVSEISLLKSYQIIGCCWPAEDMDIAYFDHTCWDLNCNEQVCQ